MVSEGVGSIFRRTDGRYLIYLPRVLVENRAFPFPIEKLVKVKDPVQAWRKEANHRVMLVSSFLNHYNFGYGYNQSC